MERGLAASTVESYRRDLRRYAAVLGGRGKTRLDEITAALPEVRCLILTCLDDDESMRQAIEAGAAGFIVKEIVGTDLIEAIRDVAAGRSLPYPAS